jgi:hypothetical protein
MTGEALAKMRPGLPVRITGPVARSMMRRARLADLSLVERLSPPCALIDFISDRPPPEAPLPLPDRILESRQLWLACVLAGRNIRERDGTVSLWEPWTRADLAGKGPERFDVPDKLWLLGLGHLGQAFAWTLCFVPGTGDRLIVLQDDQFVGEENEATSLLVLPGDGEMGKRKTR